ncbi:MAG: hypothetical protein EOM69_12040, partial [Clostridia bacterium]|nr:hypothetical protein [Clostridia bacterium]
VMDGVCLDEMSQDSLDMSEIYGALTSAQKSLNGQKLAFVGFDACLMATYEMARHVEPFADYLIASEELEPGGGWAYDGWLGQLGKTPGMSVEKLGKQIVDSFITGTVQNDYTDYATLSVVDLSKLGGVQKALESMGESLQSKIDGGEFGTVSRIRRGLRSFGEISSSISTDMIDAGVFASAYQKQDASGAKALRSALKDAVVYSAHTNNLTDLSGLSVFVPYSTKNAAHTYLPAYDSQGLYPRYAGFVSQMLSKLTGQSFFFDMPAIGQTDAQQAQIDWFSQFADDPQTYQAAAEQAAQSPDDFSLDSFLGSLFGAGGTADVDESYTQEYNQPEAVTSANYETYAQTQTEAAIAIETAQNQQLVFQNPFAQVFIPE